MHVSTPQQAAKNGTVVPTQALDCGGAAVLFGVYGTGESPLKQFARFNDAYSFALGMRKASRHPLFVVDERTNTTVLELEGGLVHVR